MTLTEINALTTEFFEASRKADMRHVFEAIMWSVANQMIANPTEQMANICIEQIKSQIEKLKA